MIHIVWFCTNKLVTSKMMPTAVTCSTRHSYESNQFDADMTSQRDEDGCKDDAVSSTFTQSFLHIMRFEISSKSTFNQFNNQPQRNGLVFVR